MALTESQKLQAKKHMDVWVFDSPLNSSFAALEDGGAKEAELVAAIELCETRYAAINTAVTASDELTEGGGAKFNYHQYAALRKRWYEAARRDLARILGVDYDSLRGNSAQMTGWRV